MVRQKSGVRSMVVQRNSGCQVMVWQNFKHTSGFKWWSGRTLGVRIVWYLEERHNKNKQTQGKTSTRHQTFVGLPPNAELPSTTEFLPDVETPNFHPSPDLRQTSICRRTFIRVLPDPNFRPSPDFYRTPDSRLSSHDFVGLLSDVVLSSIIELLSDV
ncbi:hypothetical protein MA16_Dca014246 [Dendrobium catenatum]|uniref:Uncharacterized protein n=1 Tax=Dendrobium catenatum TaxID=906689 RepID=A0A2I0VJU3_9ASPA|nr:hypothetical protein MA16_Dca014246 [Dendrobium catenatum]